jgi:hypothetical protein
MSRSVKMPTTSPSMTRADPTCCLPIRSRPRPRWRTTHRHDLGAHGSGGLTSLWPISRSLSTEALAPPSGSRYVSRLASNPATGWRRGRRRPLSAQRFSGSSCAVLGLREKSWNGDRVSVIVTG